MTSDPSALILRAAGDEPKRIQRSRAKGWRKPAGAIVVTRPGPWGNPFPVRGVMNRESSVAAFEDWVNRAEVPEWAWRDQHGLIRAGLAAGLLRGHDLACWCPLDGVPCHADVLLELANA